MTNASRFLFVALSPLVSACGWSPFVEPKANPIIEDKVGAFRTMATTGERRIAFVRTEDLKLTASDAKQQQNAKRDVDVRDEAIARETTECASNKDKSKGCNRGGHEFFARRLIGQFGGKAGEFCAEPSPDSIESLATTFGAALSGNISSTAGASEELKASLAKSLATNAASVFRRSQGVQLYRDGAFFLCQAMMNGYIDAAEYQEALYKLRSDAKDIIKAEFDTQAWKSAPQIIIVTAPTSPKVDILDPDAKKSGAGAADGKATDKKGKDGG